MKEITGNMAEQGEVVLYNPNDEVKLEVRVEDDTVWLNRQQLAELFGRDVKTIGKHVNNALNEELNGLSVVAKFATTASDGKTYQIEYYNLDMVLSIGYRVKSSKGIKFRRWANNVLKEYLLKGYSVNQRLSALESRSAEQEEHLKQIDGKIDFFVRSSLPPVEGVFYNGQIFDAYKFAADLIRSANQSIILIDNYIDESVLMMLSKRQEGVAAEIFTKSIGSRLQLDIEKHNQQYPPIKVMTNDRFHDRFLIIDGSDVYHIGASLKDLGKKLFAFSKLNINPDLLTYEKSTYTSNNLLTRVNLNKERTANTTRPGAAGDSQGVEPPRTGSR
jgi:hypothetical protein